MILNLFVNIIYTGYMKTAIKMIYMGNVGRPPSKPRTDFGARLAAAREKAGLSQRALAEAMDVAPQVVGKWERTASAVTSDTLKKLAVVLDTTADELLGLTPVNKQPGPTGKAKQLFEEVSRLPRKQQAKILEVVEAFVAAQGQPS